MNEKVVIKKSRIIFLIGLLLSIIVSIWMHQINYCLAVVLGYMIGLLVFYITIKATDLILEMQSSGGIIAISFLMKMLLYLLGFYLAYLFPNVFDMISVFLSYFIIKITIIVVGLSNKGGETNDEYRNN